MIEPIGLTGMAALEAEMRDRLAAKTLEIESIRAQLATARKALEDEVRYAEAGTPKKFLEKSLSYRAGVWQRLRAALNSGEQK